MLVTCPECGARISDMADPCPKCGFPEAGGGSKEVAENFAQRLRGLKGYTTLERCNNCGFKPNDSIESKAVEVKVEKQETRYTTRCYFRCPKCGEKVKGNFGWWAGFRQAG